MKVDVLNTFLILVSALLAYILPFELFLISYAFLGPLHYLTEINWIREKNYFFKNSYWLKLCLVLSALIVLPKLLNFSFFGNLLNQFGLYNLLHHFDSYTNILICFLFCFPLIMSAKIKKVIKISLLVISVVLSYITYKTELYSLIIGAFLLTIIHVYVFTLLFMIYGYLSKKNTFSLVNIGLVLLLPVLFFVIPVTFSNYKLSQLVTTNFIDSGFYMLNLKITTLFNLADPTQFNFSNIYIIRMQMFIAFAYTYHYLNWFSKTTVIGWYKKITLNGKLLIATFWVASIALYVYDYKSGLLTLLFLSLLHVFLEFPLNIMCIKQINTSIFSRIKP